MAVAGQFSDFVVDWNGFCPSVHVKEIWKVAIHGVSWSFWLERKRRHFQNLAREDRERDNRLRILGFRFRQNTNITLVETFFFVFI